MLEWGTALYAQDKYLLKSPGRNRIRRLQGIRRLVGGLFCPNGVLKVIVANPTMINAYKPGTPSNSQPFPDGSMIVKLQWKPKKSTKAPFVVDVPDVFSQMRGVSNTKAKRELNFQPRPLEWIVDTVVAQAS